jgi:hypothetical protein
MQQQLAADADSLDSLDGLPAAQAAAMAASSLHQDRSSPPLSAEKAEPPSPSRPGSTVKQRRQQRRDTEQQQQTPPSSSKRHSRVSIVLSPEARSAAQQQASGSGRRNVSIAPQTLVFLLLAMIILGSTMATVCIVLLASYAADSDFDSRIMAWSSASSAAEQQQRAGWLQGVLHQARDQHGGGEHYRHKRSKRMAADPRLALELPTFFRSASSSAASSSLQPLRWLDRHHQDRALSDDQLALMLAQAALSVGDAAGEAAPLGSTHPQPSPMLTSRNPGPLITVYLCAAARTHAAGGPARAQHGLSDAGSGSALMPSDWDAATYLGLWPDLQQAGLSFQQASDTLSYICGLAGGCAMLPYHHRGLSRTTLPLPQAKEHYLLHGATERRVYLPYPLLLRYSSCGGLFNQHYSHIAGLRASHSMRCHKQTTSLGAKLDCFGQRCLWARRVVLHACQPRQQKQPQKRTRSSPMQAWPWVWPCRRSKSLCPQHWQGAASPTTSAPWPSRTRQVEVVHNWLLNK